jgi:hypothetical protein
LGGELQAGVIEQPRVEIGQGGPVFEEDISAVFGLVDDPVRSYAALRGRTFLLGVVGPA